MIPENHSLQLRITDIDMAGDIQPWRNRTNANIRYIEPIFPPRMRFDFTLVDADGNVVLEGSENLVDLAFDFGITTNLRREPFYYELTMLGNWIRRTFRE